MARPLPVEGATRGVDPSLIARAAAAWGYVVPGGRIRVTTGVSSHSPVNHAPGHAIDFQVIRPDGSVVHADHPESLIAAQVGRAMGVRGIGYGSEYMGGTHHHWDVSANGYRTWGDDDGGASDNFGAGSAEHARLIAAATGQPVSVVLSRLGFDGASAPNWGASSDSGTIVPQDQTPNYGGILASLAGTESGGDFSASNNVAGSGGSGHFGRLQFSRGRLGEAQAAGVIPPDMKPEDFLSNPQAQRAVEQWHLSDIHQRIQSEGLDRYVGRNIAGQRLTMSSLIAMAHLGGFGGMRQFLKTGGAYNPSDAYGTSLLDYASRHADAPLHGGAPSPTGSGTEASFGQYAGSTATSDPSSSTNTDAPSDPALAAYSERLASRSQRPTPSDFINATLSSSAAMLANDGKLRAPDPREERALRAQSSQSPKSGPAPLNPLAEDLVSSRLGPPPSPRGPVPLGDDTSRLELMRSILGL